MFSLDSTSESILTMATKQNYAFAICIDLCYLIYSFLDFVDKMNYREIYKRFNKFEITDLYNIDNEYTSKLNQNILKQSTYANVTQLCVDVATNITDLNFLKKLKRVRFINYHRNTNVYDRNHGVTNDGIKYLNLEELCVGANFCITNLNQLTTLKKLDISGSSCKVGDNGIKNLKLEELNASFNKNITNLNQLTTLKKLDICGFSCKVGDTGIKNLKLEELDVEDNDKITNLNHMITLKKLNISWECGVNDEGIKNLNLYELDAEGNDKITNLNHMSNLKKLNISGEMCGVDDNGIKNLNLEELEKYYNEKITTLNHMDRLKKLNNRHYGDTKT